MENLSTRNSQQDSDDSDETDSEDSSHTDASSESDEATLLKAKRNNDSALLIEKLILAVEEENEDNVKSLLDKFFDTSYNFVKSWISDSHQEEQKNDREIWEDAMYIAMREDTKHSDEIMKLLLDCDIIWNLETNMDDPLLRQLIPNENKDGDKNLRVFKMLLKSGIINVNARDKYMRTALHYAEEEKLISLLIRYGADVNKKDEYGNTPLMHIMWAKRVPVLQTILQEARTLVDLDAFDCDGRTALMMAVICNQPHTVELLLNAGASVNLSDHLGFTALHHALLTEFDHIRVLGNNVHCFRRFH